MAEEVDWSHESQSPVDKMSKMTPARQNINFSHFVASMAPSSLVRLVTHSEAK